MDRAKYVTNKDLLPEIHASKCSFCYFVAPEDRDFDAILPSVDGITVAFAEQTLEKRLDQIVRRGPSAWPHAFSNGAPTIETLVFRVMTSEHIPMDDGTRKRRATATGAIRTAFPPFKHYRIKLHEDGTFSRVEVGRSHWKGDMETGSFCDTHGDVTRRLARMWVLLVNRYAMRANWRNYTYNDEMKGHALMQLSQVGLQFDESKSDNPFSFYTQCIKNCFRRVLNVERKAQNIRDDLLIMAGVSPSFTRQIDNEFEQRMAEQAATKTEPTAAAPNAEPAPAPKKRGRKPKVPKSDNSEA